MTLYELLPFLADYQAALIAVAFVIAVAIGRTVQQHLYYRKKDARPLWLLPFPRKHQADTISDQSLVLLALVGGIKLEVIAALSIGLWSIVQIGIHRAFGHPDFWEGEDSTWDLRVFGRTIHIPKFSGGQGRIAIPAAFVLAVIAHYTEPLTYLF